eukprot:3581214-Prymnesium_polylepis.1
MRQQRQPSSLENLTVQEVKVVVRLLRLQAELSGAVERPDIERVIEARISAASPDAAIGSLPNECLRAILDVRSIPHGNLVDRAELAKLVERSPHGTCLTLPVGVLRRML